MTHTPIQTVTLAGEDYAVVPLAEYEALRNSVHEDAMDAAIMKRVLEDPDQELVPFARWSRESRTANTPSASGAGIAA